MYSLTRFTSFEYIVLIQYCHKYISGALEETEDKIMAKFLNVGEESGMREPR